MEEIILNLTNGALDNLNYGWVILFMAIESSFIPFPSEVVIIPAAYMAVETGEMTYPMIILCGTFISCYLLIAEIPMFALKFKTWGWKGNEVKYIFILSCIPLLLLLGVSALAAIIAWYVILSVFTIKKIETN